MSLLTTDIRLVLHRRMEDFFWGGEVDSSHFSLVTGKILQNYNRR